MKRIYAIALAAILVAVGVIVFWPGGHSGPQPLAFGRDACARCRMHLARPGFGGELRDARGQLTTYDDVGCLLQSMWAMHEQTEAWVEDHDDGHLVALTAATFVRSSRVETPMNYGVLAFASDGGARRFAGAQGGEVVTLEQLLADKARLGGAASARKPGQRPLTEKDARMGKPLYVRECAGCHGERGDGKGPAAAFLDPKPRNFLAKLFKLRTTEGQVPATADVLRTIERGLPGSAMPSFAFLAPEERDRIAAYVLDLADALDTPEPPVVDPGTPPAATAESVARGKAIYEHVQCGACHGPRGRGDGPSAANLRDDDGNPIPVRDFTGGQFRGGGEREDLYYRFVTGMDGTPMPAFRDQIQGADRWALVDFVRSLRVEAPPVARPADAILAGRQVAEKFSCRGCHVLDDGRGGDVGPDLRVSGQKLGSDWVRTFLKDPRAYGKIYFWRPQRMPRLALGDEEIAVLARYLAAMGKRRDAPVVPPDPAEFPQAKLDLGKNIFLLRCTECHNLGHAIETPLAKQQGPDLARVAPRVDYEWAKRWISNPHQLDPKTRMTVPGITPEQVEAVRMFVWKTSIESESAKTAALLPANH
jgi:mono/diheme cytochrome c family protein